VHAQTAENVKKSVVIPFKDRIPLLMESIKSVQSQTYKNYEIILVDDHSDDDKSTLLEYIESDKKLKYVIAIGNGVSAARNLGVKHSSGSYIAFLDSDDLFVPEKLEKQLSYMIQNNLDFSHTSYNRVSQSGMFLETRSTRQFQGNFFPEILENCGILTSTVMAKREVFTKNEFADQFSIGEDVCVFIDITYEYEIGVVDEPLTQFRVSDLSAFMHRDKQVTGISNIVSYILDNPNYYSHVKETLACISILGKIGRPELVSAYTLKLESLLKSLGQRIPATTKEGATFFPLISIIIPVYNGANFLQEAINSALGQFYSNIEVIVVNDGSTDNGETEKLALSYGDKILYIHKENGGVATALNAGIESMRGEYFSWLSHDDVYNPNKIHSQVTMLESLEDKTTIIACPYSVMDKDGNEFYVVTPFDKYSDEQLSRPLFPLLRGYVNGCCLLIHRSHFDRIGVFNEALPTTQDFDLWFRMMREKEIKYSREICVRSRSHEEQGSKKDIKPHIEECNNLWIDFMKQLTDDEKCAIDSSVYKFYEQTYSFLSTSSQYDRAIDYINGCMLRAAHNDYVNASDSKKKSLYHDMMINLDLGKSYVLGEEFEDVLSKKKIKPRISFFTNDLTSGGGLIKSFLDLAQMLCKEYEIYILHSQWCDRDYESLPNNDIQCVYFAPILDDGGWQQRLSKILSMLEIDISIIMFNWSDMYLRTFESNKRFGIKNIAWNHENYFLPYWNHTYIDSIIERNKYFSYADAVVWLTSYSANVYSLHGSNGVVIPNTAQIAHIPLLDTKPRSQNIIAVGRFDDPIKGLDKLLLSFAKVLNKCPDSKLTVVGSYDFQMKVDSLETIGELVERLCFPTGSLEFTGWTKDVELYYQDATVHVLPSKYEGFGLVILEAAAYGVPSVLFSKNGYDDIVENGKTGFIIEADNVNEMANKIQLLLTDVDLLERIKSQLPSMIERFDATKISSKWYRLIDAVLNTSGDELNLILNNDFMSNKLDNEIFMRDIASEYENTTVRIAKEYLQLKRLNSSITSIQPAIQNSYNIDVKQLLQETQTLVSNIHSVYSGLLAQASNLQATGLELTDLHQVESEQTSISQYGNRKVGVKLYTRQILVYLIRKIFRPTKRLLTHMRLEPFITRTSIYRKLRIRGVMEKLNR